MGDALPDTSNKPVVVMQAFPIHGHVTAPLQVATHLVSRGHPVYLIAGTSFATQARATGATFIENTWDATAVLLAHAHVRGPRKAIMLVKHLFVDHAPQAYRLMCDTLEMVRSNYGREREVVIWHEAMAMGLLPFAYGAPLPKGYDVLPRMVNFHSMMNLDHSGNVFPMGRGRTAAVTPKEREECKEAWREFDGQMGEVAEHVNAVFPEIGAHDRFEGNLFARFMHIGEMTVFLFPSGLDFAREDPGFDARYLGTFPLPVRDDVVLPGWWDEVLQAKTVVFVSQGTINIDDYGELVVPTLTAFVDRADTLVVATLGRKGAVLDKAIELPANARVLDYFPYETILGHTDVFVNNAGFGALLHGVQAGVPMVMAGVEIDKADVCRRAEAAGVAVSLDTQTPGKEAIVQAVDRILADGRYKEWAVELMLENEALGAPEAVERIIMGQDLKN